MDNANYPDCTPEFVGSMTQLINTALGDGSFFKIVTPLLYLSKAETVLLAKTFGDKGDLAISHSHTCYAGDFPPCGVCHACTLRAEGFRRAGVADPLLERAARVAS
jgi:7-cyano-7-deazaguanine synthase